MLEKPESFTASTNARITSVAHTSPVRGLGRSVWQQHTSLACLGLQSKRAGSVSS